MSKNKIVSIAIVSLLLCVGQSVADVVGSDTAVTVQGTYPFPQSPLTANRIASFTWMQGGFTFQNASTGCLFDSVFPVSGTIQLNGGTLTLNRDLIFNNTSSLQGLGTIVGGNHTLELCSTITFLPSDTSNFQNTSIIMHGSLALHSAITFQGTCEIMGNNSMLSLGSTGSLIVGSNSSLLLKDIIIQDIAGTNIQCADNTGNIILDNVIWDQTASSTFAQGSLQVNNSVTFLGTSTFYYTSSQTSTISSASQWDIAQNLTLSIGMQSLNGVQPVAFTDPTSRLKFDQSYWLVTPLGMQITKGNLVFANQVELDMQGSSTTHGLIIGDGIAADDALFNLNSGASLRFGSGFFTYNNAQPNYLGAPSGNATMIRALASQFFVNTSVVIPQITFLFESILVPPAQFASGVTLTYNNVKVKFPVLEIDLTCVSYLPRGVLTMNGGDTLFLTKGTLPSAVNISGAQNSITGNGNLAGIITLQDSNTTLGLSLQNGSLQQNMILNGGSLALSSNFNVANSIVLTGSGTVGLANNTFNFGETDLLLTNTLYWNGTNGIINIPSNLTLSGIWTFSGHCILDCNNNNLDIGNGSLVVERGSSLTIRNALIRNINGNNIRCNDTASVLTIENCSWQQSSNYTFTIGSLQFENAVDLKGENLIFAYQSSQPVTVQKYSMITLDTSFTFSYDPGTSPYLFQFADKTASLVLNNNATMHTTMQGLNLEVGTLFVNGNASIGSEVWQSADQSVTIDNGITFGDCANSANDFICNIAAGVGLTVASGSWNYKNMNSLSLIIGNQSTAFYVAANSALNSYQSMNVGYAITTFGVNSTLGQAPNAPYNGSIVGSPTFITIPNC